MLPIADTKPRPLNTLEKRRLTKVKGFSDDLSWFSEVLSCAVRGHSITSTILLLGQTNFSILLST